MERPRSPTLAPTGERDPQFANPSGVTNHCSYARIGCQDVVQLALIIVRQETSSAAFESRKTDDLAESRGLNITIVQSTIPDKEVLEEYLRPALRHITRKTRDVPR
jgi:hypothetical protein